jgi:hypothetical protein
LPEPGKYAQGGRVPHAVSPWGDIVNNQTRRDGMYQFVKGFIVHKVLVFWYILGFCRRLIWRGITHDLSKLTKEERPSFIALAASDALRKVSYKSDEYKAILAKHKPVIDVHYKNNSHHPDHYQHGVTNMDLFDMIEMVCDWRAAGRRTKGGNLAESFRVNHGRYEIPLNIHRILKRTFIKGEE